MVQVNGPYRARCANVSQSERARADGVGRGRQRWQNRYSRGNRKGSVAACGFALPRAKPQAATQLRRDDALAVGGAVAHLLLVDPQGGEDRLVHLGVEVVLVEDV